jgi:hypothetical protein
VLPLTLPLPVGVCVPSGSVDPLAFLADPFAAFSARRFYNPTEDVGQLKISWFFFFVGREKRPTCLDAEGAIVLVIMYYHVFSRYLWFSQPSKGSDGPKRWARSRWLCFRHSPSGFTCREIDNCSDSGNGFINVVIPRYQEMLVELMDS